MGVWRSKLDSRKSELQKQRYKNIEELIEKEKEAGFNSRWNDYQGPKMCSIVDPKDYEFPFENLVFEGGGSKGLAYCGAVQVSYLRAHCTFIDSVYKAILQIS